VSGEDRDRLAALAPDARITAIPTGVGELFPSRKRPVTWRLMFTGSMDWQPNEDAVTYFADTILRLSPPVDGRIQAFPWSCSKDEFPVAERAGILVTGTVEDVRPYIAEAAVYVVPLRAGGGTRLKIFEALAMQKPVVSTSVGAEGLALTPGQEFIALTIPTHSRAK
jgi:glycosyltransferase involved in cell wall biosynthesis